MAESRSFDVVIVGAGIVGCALARECAREGWAVAVVEGGVPAGGATAAGMGHVVAMDDSPAQLALTVYSQSLWKNEAALMPRSAELEQCGTIWVAADDEEMEECCNKRRTYREVGIATEVLDTRLLGVAEPHLRRGLAGGLLVSADSVIYPPAAAAYFLEQARLLGCEFLSGRAISAQDGCVVLDGGLVLRSKRIVLATGAESELLPPALVRKRKGHLVITDRYPGFVRHQLVELGYLKSAHESTSDSVAFNVQPRQTGQVLLGSSRQFGNEDRTTDAEVLKQMVDRAVWYMPRIEELSVLRVWTGFRAATLDKLPFIGSAESITGDRSLWLAAGFEGLGITNAPGAARLLTDQMTGRVPEIQPEPYEPSRSRVETSFVHA